MFFKKIVKLKKNLNPEKIYGIAPGPDDERLEAEKASDTSGKNRNAEQLVYWEKTTNCQIASKFVCPSCGEVRDKSEIVAGHVFVVGQEKIRKNLKIVPICKECSHKKRLRPFDVVSKYVVSVK